MRAWGFPFMRRAVRPRVGRMLLAMLGVGVSAVLVLVLLSAQRGLAEGVRAYTGQPGVDLWVAPRGTQNLVRSSAVLPLPLLSVIEGEAGVASVQPLLRTFVTVTLPPSTEGITVLAMGYRGPDGLGGPPALRAGRGPASSDEIVLDRAAAARIGASIGDRVLVNDRELDVVGISRGTNLIATQFAFVDATAAERAAGYRGRASFLLVDLDPGADPGEVASRIEDRISTVQAWPTATFVAQNLEEALAGFRPFMVLVTLLGTASGTLLVALLVQGAVDDRQRDIAVLLALGVPLRSVVAAVLAEATSLVTIGVLVGGVLGLGLQGVLGQTVAALEFDPRVGDVAAVAALFLAGSLLAALLPVLRLRRIDPVEAFRP